MSNFNLTPQYELFVEAKLAFIVNALMPLKMESLECLQDPEIDNAIQMFTEAFSYHGTPYGTAAVAARKTQRECDEFNSNYALDRLEEIGQSLAWNNLQASLSGDIVRVLYATFESRLSNATSKFDTLTASPWSLMERIWRFLVTAPERVLTVIGNMRYMVPVTPTSWDVINNSAPTPINMAGLHNELFKEGFVWPNSPITFIPFTPFNDPRTECFYVVAKPSGFRVDYVKDNLPKMSLVFSIMRELFGHLVTCKFVLPAGTDKAFAELTNSVKQEFGSWAGVPDWHFLHTIRGLLNDCRCTDNRLSYDNAKKVTLVTLLEFADAVRVFREGDRGPIAINDAIQNFVELIVAPNMGFFNLLLDSYPAFTNHR